MFLLVSQSALILGLRPERSLLDGDDGGRVGVHEAGQTTGVAGGAG